MDCLLEVAAYLNYMCLEIQFLSPCKSTYRHKSVKHIDRVLNDFIRRPENLSRITTTRQTALTVLLEFCARSHVNVETETCVATRSIVLCCESADSVRSAVVCIIL